jgi:hypothetical protein
MSFDQDVSHPAMAGFLRGILVIDRPPVWPVRLDITLLKTLLSRHYTMPPCNDESLRDATLQ